MTRVVTPGTPGGSPGGDGILVDVIRLPEECFAPIILFGGDSDGPWPVNSSRQGGNHHGPRHCHCVRP